MDYCSTWRASDSVSEWLRRWTRNPLGSARRGSNPLAVASSTCLMASPKSIKPARPALLRCFPRPSPPSATPRYPFLPAAAAAPGPRPSRPTPFYPPAKQIQGKETKGSNLCTPLSRKVLAGFASDPTFEEHLRFVNAKERRELNFYFTIFQRTPRI